MNVEYEGWYLDPYGRHEQRWFSAGQPTALVRDGGIEGDDEVTGPPPGPPVRPEDDPAWDAGTDLRRADAAEADSSSAPDLLRADSAEREPPRDPEDEFVPEASPPPD